MELHYKPGVHGQLFFIYLSLYDCSVRAEVGILADKFVGPLSSSFVTYCVYLHFFNKGLYRSLFHFIYSYILIISFPCLIEYYFEENYRSCAVYCTCARNLVNFYFFITRLQKVVILLSKLF